MGTRGGLRRAWQPSVLEGQTLEALEKWPLSSFLGADCVPVGAAPARAHHPEPPRPASEGIKVQRSLRTCPESPAESGFLELHRLDVCRPSVLLCDPRGHSPASSAPGAWPGGWGPEPGHVL